MQRQCEDHLVLIDLLKRGERVEASHFLREHLNGARSDGRTLFALNEDSDKIVLLAVHETTGLLSPTGLAVGCGSPVCMVFAP